MIKSEFFGEDNLEDALLKWYLEHARELPWRNTKDPYCIWVSEIILQQTRVNQGMSYYFSFLKEFPDIMALAKAEVSDVLRVWEGLGYYRRALNMHKAAGIIAQRGGTTFPSAYIDLIELPGIGDYTASAISSVCNGEARPAIDGNVKRFLCRLFMLHLNSSSSGELARLREAAGLFMQKSDPGIMNQALIEFGALQCTPAKPECEECLFRSRCLAYKNGVTASLPVRPLKKKMARRNIIYLVICWNDGVSEFILMRNRGEEDIWARLNDFPGIEVGESFPDLDKIIHQSVKAYPFTEGSISGGLSRTYIHLLTHRRIEAQFVKIRLEKAPDSLPAGIAAINVQDLHSIPKPRLISNYLREEFPDL
jgi:A/G-specific adenine glycosylase